LDPEKDFSEVEIPTKMTTLSSLALSPEYKATSKNQKLNRPVLAGTPVWKADLAPAATLELKGEKVALAVSVRGANALSGLVVPGDYVKLMVTRSLASRPTTRPGADGTPIYEYSQSTRYETILVSPTAFRVLAVNQRLSRTRSQVSAAEAYQSADTNQQQSV